MQCAAKVFTAHDVLALALEHVFETLLDLQHGLDTAADVGELDADQVLPGGSTAGREKVVLAVKIRPGPPVDEKMTLGELIDIVATLDMWMHRIDLTRATGTEHVLTAAHDGRIVADIVAAWARLHAQPFSLTLDGPAGGTFVVGDGGADHHLDAIEFCRILAGRAPAFGLLTYSRFRSASASTAPTLDA